MTTKLTVINQSMAYLGNPVVASLNMADPVINAMSIIYDAEKLNLLSWHPWRFATKFSKLTPVPLPPDIPPKPEFSYAYTLPLDYVQSWDTYFPADYQIVGNLALTGQSPPWFWQYVYDIPETNYPGYFVLALSHQVAAKSATLLTENPETAKYWQQQADIQSMRAQNRDATSVTALSIRDNPLLANHFFRSM